MYKAATQLVGADAYKVGDSPYVVSQITAAAVAELARRHARKRLAGKKPVVDPEVERARAEAAASSRAAAAKLAEANVKAAQMTDEASLEAKKRLEAAKNEGFSKGLAEGEARGYADGLKRGVAEGKDQWAGQIQSLQSILDATVKEKANYLVDRERVLLELSLKIASKILAREVVKHPSDMKNLVKVAVKKASEQGLLLVHMNPDDLEAISKSEDGDMKGTNPGKQIQFLADEKMVKGGLRIESAGETIDAGMDTQLAEIAKGLLQEAFHAD